MSQANKILYNYNYTQILEDLEYYDTHGTWTPTHPHWIKTTVPQWLNDLQKAIPDIPSYEYRILAYKYVVKELEEIVYND